MTVKLWDMVRLVFLPVADRAVFSPHVFYCIGVVLIHNFAVVWAIKYTQWCIHIFLFLLVFPAGPHVSNAYTVLVPFALTC